MEFALLQIFLAEIALPSKKEQRTELVGMPLMEDQDIYKPREIEKKIMFEACLNLLSIVSKSLSILNIIVLLITPLLIHFNFVLFHF